jgi:NADH-quinone oxidoreductase subunit N
MFLEEPVSGGTAPKDDGGVRFSVYALAILTTIFILFFGLLVTLTGASGLL